MAGELSYSNGQRLAALIASFQMGGTLATVLKYGDPGDPCDPSWDRLAENLQRQMADAHWQKMERLVAEVEAKQTGSGEP